MTAIAAYILVINSLTYGAFAFDKAAARSGRWRISEASLFQLALLGGAAAALAAMTVHRHKTRKPLFKYGIPMVIALQAGLVAHWLATGRTPVYLLS